MIKFLEDIFNRHFRTNDDIYEPNKDMTADTEKSEASLESSKENGYKQYPDLLVILDPGHGSTTSGKRSPAAAGSSKLYPELKLWEYQWNREVVSRIASKLSLHGVQVEYTVNPEDDTDLGLSKRYKKANAIKDANPNKHCLFMSVHVNASGADGQWHSGRGWSVWTTKGQTNSDKFADCVYLVANDILPNYGQKLRKDTSDGDYDYEENFTVIYGANMPAILTENLFQDNVEDVKFLLTDEGKNILAEINTQGILNYASYKWS